jgi:hypothetical protein
MLTFIHPNIVQDPFRPSAPSQDNGAIYGRLRGGWPPQSIPAMPELGIHIRFYLEHVEDLPPLEWAKRIAVMLQGWHGSWWNGTRGEDRPFDLSTDPYVVVSVYNEMNLDYEHVGLTQDQAQSAEAYKAFAERELAVFKELDRLLPHRRCLWASSAPAPGHDPSYNNVPDSEWGIIQATGLLDYVDLVQLHVYTERDKNPESGPTGKDAYWYARRPVRPAGYRDATKPTEPHDPGGVITQFSSLYRYFISEWNDFVCDVPALVTQCIDDHQKMLLDFASWHYIAGATSFIWLSGGAHKKNIVRDNKALFNWYKNSAPQHATPAMWVTAKWHWNVVPPITTTPPPVKPIPPKPEPEHDPNPLELSVGPGVLALMTKYGDTADTDEMYQDGPFSVMSRTIAASGAVYRAWSNQVTGTWKVSRDVVAGARGGGGEIDIAEYQVREVQDNVRGLLKGDVEPGASTAHPRGRKSRR